MILDNDTLKKRLKYQGRQYAAGQIARGGKSEPHMLTQAANRIEELEKKITEHNDECVRSCNDKKRCGFVGYKSDCGNCTKDWMIDISET